MTVCIGALCHQRTAMVAATDMLVTLGLTASDVGVIKNEVLFPRWVVMTAGDDTEHIDFILDRTRQLLRKKIERKTPHEVAAKLCQAYAERLQDQISTKILSRYRFTPNTFRDSGKKKLTASVYNALAAKIAETKIRLSFLVMGFDHQGEAHIFGMHQDNPPVSYDKLAYWAIGDGAPMALASLGFFNHQPRLAGAISMPECIYQMCAAKFMAETTKTVGKQTHFVIYGPNDGQVRFLYLSDQQKIRELWQQEGAPRIPPRALGEIPDMLIDSNDPEFAKKQEQKNQEWAAMCRANPSIFQR